MNKKTHNWATDRRRIDVHCHFFNRKELNAVMLLDIVRMLSHAELSLRLGKKNSAKEKEARNMSRTGRSALTFALTAFLTPQKIFRRLSDIEQDFIFCPLMLDLYGLTQKQTKQDDTFVNTDKLFALLKQEANNVQERSDQLSKERGTTSSQRSVAIDIKRVMGSVKTLLSKRAYHSTYIGGKTPDNYPKQEEEITALAKKYPNDVLPFYAVDPRRESNYKVNKDGTYDISPMTERLRQNGGVFWGFKLYSPVGYSPTHPVLMALYAYCEKNNVPIIAHVSGSGVNTLSNKLWIEGDIYQDGQIVAMNGLYEFEEKSLFKRDRILEHSERLNHPMLWEKVLKRFPNLKIDLAHFGHLPHSMEWTKYIWKMMQEKDEQGRFAYPNLYTDLANIVDEETVRRFHDKYFAVDETLQGRFLYGSDYYMNLIYQRDMNAYYHNFTSVFTPREWDLISIYNPREFLGLPQPESLPSLWRKHAKQR